MKILFLIPIIVIATLLYLTQIDDDLSDGAQALIDRVEVDGASDSYLYFLGIFAAENEDPVDVGREVLEQSRKLDADASYQVVKYDKSKEIPIPEGEAFCKAWEDDCLSVLFSADVDVVSLLVEHEVLVFRSNIFLEFDEYKTLAKPTISEPFPAYRYLAAAERIKLLSAISFYKNGHPDKAIKSLLLQFSKLRRALDLQDNLIGKLVLLLALSEIIDVCSVILAKEDINIEKIPSLSQSEKSFHMVAAREFGVSYYAFKSADRHPEFFNIGGDSPGWMTRAVFKPNMSINQVAPIFYRLERLVEMSPVDFATAMESPTKADPPASLLRNYVGAALVSMSGNFDIYAARFIDFGAKLMVFNQKYTSANPSLNLKNPYNVGEVLKEIDGSICFNGPLEDKRKLRCLKVGV